jgi:hypothetical protein
MLPRPSITAPATSPNPSPATSATSPTAPARPHKVHVRSDIEPRARRVAREIACSPDNLSGATRRQAHAGFERLPGRVQAAARSPDGALRDLQGQRVKRVLQRVRTVSLSLI